MSQAATIGQQLLASNTELEGEMVSWRKAIVLNAALHVALVTEDVDKAYKCIFEGADPSASTRTGEALLLIACRLGNTQLLRILLEAGASVTAADDASGEGPLHVCTSARPLSGAHVECVRMLLERGADPMARTATGKTAFDLCPASGPIGISLHCRRIREALDRKSGTCGERMVPSSCGRCRC